MQQSWVFCHTAYAFHLLSIGLYCAVFFRRWKLLVSYYVPWCPLNHERNSTSKRTIPSVSSTSHMVLRTHQPPWLHVLYGSFSGDVQHSNTPARVAQFMSSAVFKASTKLEFNFWKISKLSETFLNHQLISIFFRLAECLPMIFSTVDLVNCSNWWCLGWQRRWSQRRTKSVTCQCVAFRIKIEIAWHLTDLTHIVYRDKNVYMHVFINECVYEYIRIDICITSSPVQRHGVSHHQTSTVAVSRLSGWAWGLKLSCLRHRILSLSCKAKLQVGQPSYTCDSLRFRFWSSAVVKLNGSEDLGVPLRFYSMHFRIIIKFSARHGRSWQKALPWHH